MTNRRFRRLAVGGALAFALCVPVIAPIPASASSSPVGRAPAAPIAAKSVPGLVRDLQATSGNERAVITWRAPSNTGGLPIIGYRIQARVGGTWQTVADKGPSTRRYVHKNLTNGLTYRYRVAAINALGRGDYGKAGKITLQVVKSLALGLDHTCALRIGDKRVLCWGGNTAGQLGDGSTDPTGEPSIVPNLFKVRSIASGEKHNCAVVAKQKLKCWGGNDFGGIGDGTTDKRLTPFTVPLADVVEVGAGQFHTCARTSDGSVWCWGSNNFGQLGDGTTDQRNSPVKVQGITDAVRLGIGYFHSCAILATGTTKCWGQNGAGQLGDGTNDDRHTPVTVSGLTGARRLAGGGSFTCAITATFGVSCWGENTSGQLGDGTTTTRPNAADVDIEAVAALSSGHSHVCARVHEGPVYCWGENEFIQTTDEFGQVGSGSGADELSPIAVGKSFGAKAIGTGKYHSCMVQANAGVRCWGFNASGQLGDGTTVDQDTPSTKVPGFTPI